MVEMVERVARAIALEDSCDPDFVDTKGRVQWTYHVSVARAAIAAMREPTIGILMAGVGGSAVVGDDGSSDCADSLQVERAWQAMIDEALKP